MARSARDDALAKLRDSYGCASVEEARDLVVEHYRELEGLVDVVEQQLEKIDA